MRKALSVIALTFACAAGLSPVAFADTTTAAPAVDSKAAQTFIRDLSDKAFAVLRDKNLTQTVREKNFRELLGQGFAIDKIASAVLGRNRRTATPEQLSEFNAAFPEYVVRIYASRLTDFSDTVLKTTGTSSIGSRGDVSVHTVVSGKSVSQPVHADWRVTQIPNVGLRIIDLSIEGISMATTQRDEFDTKIAQKGMNSLISDIKSGSSDVAVKVKLKAKK